MIRRITIRNFKCFDAIELPLVELNLLCGMNGMGKSSLIQAMLVLRQSFASGELTKGRLVLGGVLADIGRGQDVLFEDAVDDVVEFELHCDKGPQRCKLRFDYSRNTDELLASNADNSSSIDHEVLRSWTDAPPLGGNLVYVSADRLGPRKFYSHSEVHARDGNLGTKGEYAVNYLLARRDDRLPKGDRRCPDDLPSRRFIDVVDHWLGEITPGAHLQLDEIDDADAIIAGYAFDRPGDVRTRAFRAMNVGFGLSYTLPVLVSLLAPTGSLCLIENPEAHLHPKGQTKLAELAARAALMGVQLIVETHSDHFMDGVRIAVRDGLIAPGQAVFHYFERLGGRTIVKSPNLDADGRLSEWPTGFFDQHEENLARLIAQKP